MARFEVQRLCATGCDLPSLLIVDSASLLAAAVGWSELEEALARTPRRLLFVGSTTDIAAIREHLPTAETLTTPNTVHAALSGLAGAPVGLVTADVELHGSRLAPVRHGVPVLDLVTGRLWTPPVVEADGIDPSLEVLLEAIAAAPGKAGPGYHDELRQVFQVADGRRWLLGDRRAAALLDAAIAASKPHGPLPSWLVQKLRGHRAAILEHEKVLRGNWSLDTTTQGALREWAWRPFTSTEVNKDTIYALADVERDGDRLRLRGLRVRRGHAPPEFRQGRDALRLLRSLPTAQRWFAPRALDLLGVMVDNDMELPIAVVDPAMASVVMDPDEPVSLGDCASSTRVLSSAALFWLSDLRREEAETPALAELIRVLPDLDAELAELVKGEGLDDLVEFDLAPTWSALAKVERAGAPVGVPDGYSSWDDFVDELENVRDQLEEQIFAELGTVDVYCKELGPINAALERAYGQIPAAHYVSGLTDKQVYKRYVALGHWGATRIAEVRGLGEVIRWAERLSQRDHARGMWSLGSTGRLMPHRLALHSLPKHGRRARELRSALLAPSGMTLISVDYNAEEVRLLANVSADPTLLALAKAHDMHGAVATKLFGSAQEPNRDLAKVGTLAFIYGQTRRGFIRSRAELRTAQAGAIYDRTKGAFLGLGPFSSRVLKEWRKHGHTISSRGRWRRQTRKRRAAFNTIIQGLGADILRWLLRTLDPLLGQLGAHIVHLAHDEVVVASPHENVADVKRVLQKIMESGVFNDSGLLDHDVLKVGKVKEGRTWADL